MQVRITQALNGQLIAERLDPNVLVTRFSEWKAGDEYSSYFFGKDALGLNTSILRHVHMIPLHDAEQLATRKLESGLGQKTTGEKDQRQVPLLLRRWRATWLSSDLYCW